MRLHSSYTVFRFSYNSSMMAICQTCGDEGKLKLLSYCSQCQVSVKHRYCLKELPKTQEEKVTWICEECSKVSPNTCRKSERIRLRVQEATEAKIVRKKRKGIKLIATKAQVLLDENKANQIRNDLSIPNKEIGNHFYFNETHGNQGHRKRRRLVLQEDEDGFDEKSKSVKASQLGFSDHDNKLIIDDSYFLKNKIGNHYFFNGMFEKEFRKQKSKLTLQDKGSPNEDVYDSMLNITYTLPLLELHNVFAQPTIHPIWKGCFSIKNGKHDTTIRLVAHVSSKACSKVFYVASTLPSIINVQILPKFDTWPTSFQKSPPTDGDIGLYFFPEYERDEKVFDMLVDEIIDLKLALKAMINNIELLVFSSQELPHQHWRFLRKYYLWGAFRVKQGFIPSRLCHTFQN